MLPSVNIKSNNSPSVHSYSELFNLSLESSEEEPLEAWETLLRRLTTSHIEKLHESFMEQDEDGLTKEEFVNTIDKVLENCRYSVLAISLFDQIFSTKLDTGLGKINWTDYIEFVATNTCAVTDKLAELTVQNIFGVPHVKRDAIIKIVLIEMESFFCYAVVAKYGGVGLYDGNMNFVTSYQIVMSREDVSRSDRERRRRNRWITDAIFLRDSLMLVIANSTRSVTIYDASGLEHLPMWLITDFPNSIQYIAYCVKENDCRLIFGDDTGQIIHFKFVQPKFGYLRKKHNDRISIFFWLQLLRYEKEFVLIKIHPKIHKEAICQMEYFEDNHTLVSCSRDSKNSVTIQQLFANGKDYYFQMVKGCSCFALSRNSHYLVTGSDDGILRLWNQFVTKKPLEAFNAHSAGIIDVKIIDRILFAISCSRKGEIKLWDLKNLKCAQKLLIKYPCFDVLGKLIEWGTSSIFPGPKRSKYMNENNDTASVVSSQISQRTESKPEIARDGQENIWDRSQIHVTCCNFIASLSITFATLENSLEMPVLPPPPLQNSVLIPKSWKIRENIAEIEAEGQTYPQEIGQYLESLKFILGKDLLSENNMNNEINYRIAQLETKKLEMQDKVKECAPYLALDLFEMNEVKLTQNLPIPSRRKIQRLVEKTQRMLSAASSKSLLFSESSSRSRSSRSSVIEFL